MADDWSVMYGEVATGLRPRSFSRWLATVGLEARVKESGHYKGAQYLRVPVGMDSDFTLERVGSGEYLAHADAPSVEQVRAVASLVSRALTELGMRHRFEVYDGQSQLAHYWHHRWPQGADD
jgi:hypothetical protein